MNHNIDFVKHLMTGFLTRYHFSNKDYFSNNPLKVFDHESVVHKVRTESYGICMELNYVFSLVLKNYGFDNYLVKCYKQKYNGEFYDLYHLGIIAEVNHKDYFIDVGFGEHFIEPVFLQYAATTGLINVEIVNSSYKGIVYDLSIGDKHILRIVDKPILDMRNISDNYYEYFEMKPEDFPFVSYSL